MNNAHLQTNALSPPQSPQPISPLHYSGNHTHHHLKYLEQLLDSSLATVAVIQFSGNNTLADVLTPRTHDTFKALYALAALDAPASTRSTKPGGNEIPTFSDIGKDCPYSSNRSPPCQIQVLRFQALAGYIYQSLWTMSCIFRVPDWRLSPV
jgi:hypothetical protein